MPSLGVSDIVTLTITTVSPQRTTHEPLACSAYLPVSTSTFLPPISVSNTLKFCVILLSLIVLCEDTETSPLLDKRAEHLPRPYYYLFSQIQTGNDLSVSFDVLGFDVVQKSASLSDHFQKAAAGMVILRIRLQMRVEVVDTLRQKRDLHFGRPRVAVVSLVLVDDACIFLDRKSVV